MIDFDRQIRCADFFNKAFNRGVITVMQVKGLFEIAASRDYEELLRVISAGCVVDFMGYPPSLLDKLENQRLVPVIEPTEQAKKLLQEFPFLGEEPFVDNYTEVDVDDESAKSQTCSATPTRRFDQAVAAGAQALYDSVIEELRKPKSRWAEPYRMYQLGKFFVDHQVLDTDPGFLSIARDHFLGRLRNGELELSYALNGNQGLFDVTPTQISDAEQDGYSAYFNNSVEQIRVGAYSVRNVQTRELIDNLRGFARQHGFSEALIDDALREVSVPLFRRALSEVAAGVIDPVRAVVDDFEFGQIPLNDYIKCRGYCAGLIDDALAIRGQAAEVLNAQIRALEEKVRQAYSPQQEQPAEPAPKPTGNFFSIKLPKHL
ncbi:MAG: hypothetical protein V1659_04745 [Candidatus Woesearchaeota archaeon]